ncbi:protein roadkill-like [Leguminivora glycinivorella]|uniref:protein roadkill-like n=1 Tax=Leguminivora glycinivorella TaxID=1035111 RepID=UPI00200EE2BF|nr:protein roadkill-like [Leguminivora glycinivorella]
MPIIVEIKEQRLGTILKLRCFISTSGTEREEFTSTEFNVNDLAIVRLHFKDKLHEPLQCKIRTRAISGKVIKVKVSCQDTDEAFYSEWICTNEWKYIGKKYLCDVALSDVLTNVLSINISASQVEDSPLAKLYDDVDFTDFNLSAGGGTVPVHKALLAIQSDVFRAMLTREWKEKTEGNIQMEGVTLQTLQHFKDFMYLRTLPGEGLKALLLFASYYLIDNLKAECVSKLALDCKSGEWNDLLNFAVKHQIFELANAIMIVNPTFVMKDNEKEPVKKQENEE